MDNLSDTTKEHYWLQKWEAQYTVLMNESFGYLKIFYLEQLNPHYDDILPKKWQEMPLRFGNISDCLRRAL